MSLDMRGGRCGDSIANMQEVWSNAVTEAVVVGNLLVKTCN